jgi:hypothetical protein
MVDDQFLRQDSALSSSDGPHAQMQERERDERTEGLQEHQPLQRVEGANRFEGTMKFNR